MSNSPLFNTCLDALTTPFQACLVCSNRRGRRAEKEHQTKKREHQTNKQDHGKRILETTTCSKCRGVLRFLEEQFDPNGFPKRYPEGIEAEYKRRGRKNYMAIWPKPVDLTSSPLIQKDCPLLQILNPDVRYQIWRLCLYQMRFRIQYSGGGHPHLAGVLTDPPFAGATTRSTLQYRTYRYLDLLLTCRAVCAEVLPMLYRNWIWPDSYSTLRDMYQFWRPAQLALLQSIYFEWEMPASIKPHSRQHDKQFQRVWRSIELCQGLNSCCLKFVDFELDYLPDELGPDHGLMHFLPPSSLQERISNFCLQFICTDSTRSVKKAYNVLKTGRFANYPAIQPS